MIGRSIPWGIKFTRKDLDLNDLNLIEPAVLDLKPSAILHLASLDLRQCEKSPFEANKVNILATLELCKSAKELNIPFIFISSGAVFQGNKDSEFTEMSKPDPINVYGQTKYLAEIYIRRYYENHLILRTGWVFGGHGANHKKFIDVVFEKIKNNQIILANSEQKGSPTYVNDLIAVTQDLLLKNKTGTFHVVNENPATAMDIAKFMNEILNTTTEVAEYLPNQYEQISRSKSEYLKSEKIQLRNWKSALQEYILSKESSK